MVRSVEGYAGRLLSVVNETFDTKPSNDIEAFIRKKKKVGHTECLRYFRAKRGLNAKRFREAVWALVQEGSVKAGRNDRGGVEYEWVG